MVELSPGGAGGKDRSWSIEPSKRGDLRRRLRREQASQLLERAWAIPEADRLLLESLLRDGRPTREIALLTRLDVREVRRRARRLMLRLASPRFVFVVRERERWSSTRRRVAEACVVRGLSMCRAATELGMSFHRVRRSMEWVQTAYEHSRSMPRQTRRTDGGRVEVDA